MADDEQKHTIVAFLHPLVAHYRAHGVRVQRVMTDNGSAYRSKDFAAAGQHLSIKYLRTRPYTPRTNGKA